MFLEYRLICLKLQFDQCVNTLSSTADFVCVGVVKVLSPDLQYYFIILLLFYLNSTIKL